MKHKKRLIIVAIFVLALFLRFYKLGSVPVSLFGDELDVGYQAYSVLKTGSDYYGNFLPFHFHSLAEWRTPLYLYSTVPTVALFGISPLGVRLPAAIFGMLDLVAFYYLVKVIRMQFLNIKSDYFEIFALFFMSISPWHIEYSRAAFEVTLMLLFLLAGLYFFIRGLKGNKYLYLAAACFGFMPWVYSTAKLFVPMIVVALGMIFFKELFSVFKSKRKVAVTTGVIFVVISLPILYSIFLGGGAQRFDYISTFSDPTVETEVGASRDIDLYQGAESTSRIFHNKFVMWGATLSNNFFQSFSPEFLFVKGDLNLRHSINFVGEFYKIEAVTMLLGVIGFFTLKKKSKLQLLFAVWLIAGVIPAAITRDGGNHATRLILILPPLMFLVTYGFYRLMSIKNKFISKGAVVSYFFVLAVLFGHYEHQYWIHNPLNSERWWHYGWQEAVATVKAEESNYDKIVISTADEPPWIFFAAWYEYPPKEWQANFPLDHKVELPGFGNVSYIGKFYFGSPEKDDPYEFGKVIDKHTLYLASAKEVGPNLVMEPGRTPADLNLIKAVAYPSGEPAFYIFSGKNE